MRLQFMMLASGWSAIQRFKNDLKPAIALHEPVVAWVAEHSRLEVWATVNWNGAILNCTAFQPYRTSAYMGMACRTGVFTGNELY